VLLEEPLEERDEPLPQRALAFLEEGRARFPSLERFDFVPSDYPAVWRRLAALPCGRFCEWGSGFGIVTGLAEMLGFEAWGVEIDPALAEASRRLLADFGLSAQIETGDYLHSARRADVYFAYLWPGQTPALEAHFETVAPDGARLVHYWGPERIECAVLHRGPAPGA
jgi:hypothetical protein